MKTPLAPDETVVKEGPANMQRGIEAVGGRLALTTRRLVFESHAFNVQTGVTIVDRADIAGVRGVWTKFLNLIPLAPNSIAVSTRDGQEHRFVVFGRAAWLEALEAPRG